MEYRCNICNKQYSSYQSLWIHNKKFHKKDNSETNHSIIIAQSLHNQKPIQKCTFCDKTFSHYNNKWRHEKTCKNKDIKQINNNINNINNGTINNQNIIINQIGKEFINCLQIKDILKIIGDGNNGPITCIKKLNFNKDIPENHSFCTTTLEGKHFTRINHKTQKIEKINKVDFINEILNSSLTFINNISLMTEFDDEFRNKIPIDYQNKMKDIINNQEKFHQAKNKKAFFNSINDMSYNFKELILATWHLIQPNENDLISNNQDLDELIIDENFDYMSSDDECN